MSGLREVLGVAFLSWRVLQSPYPWLTSQPLAITECAHLPLRMLVPSWWEARIHRVSSAVWGLLQCVPSLRSPPHGSQRSWQPLHLTHFIFSKSFFNVDFNVDADSWMLNIYFSVGWGAFLLYFFVFGLLQIWNPSCYQSETTTVNILICVFQMCYPNECS